MEMKIYCLKGSKGAKEQRSKGAREPSSKSKSQSPSDTKRCKHFVVT